jgi:hypothetical protein
VENTKFPKSNQAAAVSFLLISSSLRKIIDSAGSIVHVTAKIRQGMLNIRIVGFLDNTFSNIVPALSILRIGNAHLGMRLNYD